MYVKSQRISEQLGAGVCELGSEPGRDPRAVVGRQPYLRVSDGNIVGAWGLPPPPLTENAHYSEDSWKQGKRQH